MFVYHNQKVLRNGTINEPPPIPNGTDINPINNPEIFLINCEIFFGFSNNLSLKKNKK